MIAKIGKGQKLYGAIAYNHNKVSSGLGSVLLTHNIPETPEGSYTASYLLHCFERHLSLNHKTEKPARHISLNPDPSDKTDDRMLAKIAAQYMLEMGYGEQPYVVYKHTDIERSHIHIVTTCVRRDGSKIPDSFDHARSMAACRKLELIHGLAPAAGSATDNKISFKPVDYSSGNIKSQVAAVIRYLPRYYSYQTFGEYNALLSLFNIAVEKVEGPRRSGLTYFALNASGEKAGNPLKASLFGHEAGLKALTAHLERSRKLHSETPKAILRDTIEAAMHMATDEAGFKKQLLDQGINMVIRKNAQGRIYGVTFIDHESRSVWNGSNLSKSLSANSFHAIWEKSDVQPSQGERWESDRETVAGEKQAELHGEVHSLFGFINADAAASGDVSGLLESVTGIFASTIGSDPEEEEEEFARRLGRKKKKPKPRKP